MVCERCSEVLEAVALGREVGQGLCLECQLSVLQALYPGQTQLQAVWEEHYELARHEVDVLQDSDDSDGGESVVSTETASIGSLEDFVADDNASIAESEWTTEEEEEDEEDDEAPLRQRRRLDESEDL